MRGKDLKKKQLINKNAHTSTHAFTIQKTFQIKKFIFYCLLKMLPYLCIVQMTQRSFNSDSNNFVNFFTFLFGGLKLNCIFDL